MRFAIRIFFLVSFSTLPQAVALAQTTEPGRDLVFKGSLKTRSGQPLAHAKVFLFGLPDSPSQRLNQDPGEFETDAKGEFSYTIRDTGHLNPNIRPGTYSFTDCRVLPVGAGLTAKPIMPPGLPFEPSLGQAFRFVTVSAQTRWGSGENKEQLNIVAPDCGRVALTLRDPSGQLIRGRQVQIMPISSGWNYVGAIVFEGRTDANGRIIWQGPEQMLRLSVKVPGVGFGSTPTLQVKADALIPRELPPLAAFGQVSGQVAPQLVTPKSTVQISTESGEHSWYAPSGKVDAQGRFTIEGTLPGKRIITLNGATEKREIQLDLGAGKQDIGLAFPQVAPASTQFVRRNRSLGWDHMPPSFASPSPSPQIITRFNLKGRVINEVGQGVSGVNLFTWYKQMSSHGSFLRVIRTTTGADGSYAFPDFPGNNDLIVAVHPSHAVTFKSIRQPFHQVPQDGSQPAEAELKSDIVLPSQSATLKVKVWKNGQPARGARVRLDDTLRSRWLSPDESFSEESGQELKSALYPTISADENGEAVFKNLRPGQWELSSTEVKFRDESTSEADRGRERWKDFNGVAQGVNVSLGKENAFSLNLLPPVPPLPFRITDPDGEQPDGPKFRLDYRQWPWIYPSSLDLEKGGEGITSGSFSHTGIKQLDPFLTAGAKHGGPFAGGTALLGVSHATPLNDPIPLQLSYTPTGNLKVELKDLRGRPTAGTIWTGNSDVVPELVTTVTSTGTVTLEDLAPADYSLQASSPLMKKPPRIDVTAKTFPTDSELSLVTDYVTKTVAVSSNSDTTVTLQPRLMGYIRGRLKVADSPADYQIGCANVGDWPGSGTNLVHRLPETGEFLIGPLPVDRATLWVSKTETKDNKSQRLQWKFDLKLKPGQVLHADLAPSEKTLERAPLWSDPDPIEVAAPQVLLSDGKTPAWGAIAEVVYQRDGRSYRVKYVNSQGQLETNFELSSELHFFAPTERNAQDTMVVSLPGSYGAAVVAVKNIGKGPILLPAAHQVRGRVTVAGQPTAALPSTFTVKAAYQGQGSVGELLNVEVTPDRDGRFELAGLTPGTYRVQAARDGIWLSASQTLVVGNNTPTEMNFDIAMPGAPLSLRFQNAKGEPLPGKWVGFQRPSGPLGEKFWPQGMFTDANGDAFVSGLEAGEHTLNFGKEKPKAVKLSVPAFEVGQKILKKTMVISSP